MSEPVLSTLSCRVEHADPSRLDDPEALTTLLRQVAQAVGLTEVAHARHRFEPQGVSAVLLLAESHVAAHTWPEDARAYLTLTSCRELTEARTQALTTLLAEHLGGQVLHTGVTRL